MVDPSKCPIPPGFEVIGGFNDDFENFRNITDYDNFNGAKIQCWGVSKRWKNSNIRTANIVCGFQFKIGPTVAERWQEDLTEGSSQIMLGRSPSGDINLYFPRKDALDNRGGYIVTIKWYNDVDGFKSEDGFITEAELLKEFPHGDYKGNYFTKLKFRGEANPRPILPQARDGQWHSFLGVIYNDWHPSSVSGSDGTSNLFPTIGLWYSNEATSDFTKFRLLGMGADLGNMAPNGPLKEGMGNVDHLFKIEHALQIRIDDVPLNEIEIRNVYAASVMYTGLNPSQNHMFCHANAKAIIDAQTKIEELKAEAKKTLDEREKHPYLGLETEEWKRWDHMYKYLTTVEIPNAISDLRKAEFMYMRCDEKFLDSGSVGGRVVGGHLPGNVGDNVG